MKNGKLLIFSDSHGCTDAMRNKILTYSPDAVCHLGDYVADAEKLRTVFPDIPFYSVKGNCDFCASAPSELSFSVFGFKIFACHGHNYYVKSGLISLCCAAEENEADICLFGHTHMPFLERRAGLTLLNPGASGDFDGSCALIEFFDGRFEAAVLNIKN